MNEVKRMQQLAGIISEIKVNNPNLFKRYQDEAINGFEILRREDDNDEFRDENNEFFFSLMDDIKKASTIKEIDDIVFKEFFLSDDKEGLEDWKNDIENKIK